MSVESSNSDDWLFSRFLKELLKAGIIVAIGTGMGTFTVGPAGGFLGGAIGAVLSQLNTSASLALCSLMENRFVQIVMSFLANQLISLGAPRLWALVVRLAQFIRERTGKMQLRSITFNTT